LRSEVATHIDAVVMAIENSVQVNVPLTADETIDTGWLTVQPDGTSLVDLIAGIQARNERALQQLYSATFSRVYGIVLRLTADPATADELTGDVYLQVWNTAHQWQASRGAPMAWLYVIARSRAIDATRRPRPAVHMDEKMLTHFIDHQADPCMHVERSQLKCELVSAIAVLNPLQRQVIGSVYLRGMTHEEIAHAFTMPLGSVKTTIRRALALLRQHVRP
jgi:RNA polymerase sigma-70 factor, ECF subfamily